MRDFYRGHEILLLPGYPRSAVILNSNTGAALPTKITAMPREGDFGCRRRARALIDIYLDLGKPAQSRSG